MITTTVYCLLVLIGSTWEFIIWYLNRGKPPKLLSVFYGIPFIGNEWMYVCLIFVALVFVISIILLMKMTRTGKEDIDDEDALGI